MSDIYRNIEIEEGSDNGITFYLNIDKALQELKVGTTIKVEQADNYFYNIKILQILKLDDKIAKIKGEEVTKPFIKKMMSALRPEKTLTVREWSDTYRYLDSSASAMSGKYSTDLTPFLREPLEALTINNGIQMVVFMKSAQVGGSEMGNCFIGYIIDIAPAAVMIVLPTDHLAKQFSKERIAPLISATPRIRGKIKNDTRNSDNTITMKKFEGGFLKLVGANSATNLRSTPIKFLFFDEVDAYPFDVDGEGSPIELALKRTTTHKRNKVLMVSTPTIKHFSNIEEYFMRGDRRHYHVHCPECNHAQHLVFEQLKFRPLANNLKLVEKSSIYYECKECKGKILESQKTKLLAQGVWKPTSGIGDPKIRSYHINSLYSPLGWKTWEEIINEWYIAKDDPTKMKTFTNTTLGLPYTDATHKPDARKLEKRKSAFREWECPDDVVYINAGIDTQDDRLAICVVGYGKNNQQYIIAYEELGGDPNTPQVWQDLQMVIDKPIKHESGINLHITDAAIDSGGHRTAYVYDFCRQNKEVFIPIIGRSFDGAMSMKRSSLIDNNQDNKKDGDEMYLYRVNNNYNKKIIYQYLANENVGRNYYYFNADLPSNFFDMLCSEERIVKIVKGEIREEFTTGITGEVRNEALDCVNYSMALARKNQIHRLLDEKKYAEYYEMNITQKKDSYKKTNTPHQQMPSQNKIGQGRNGGKFGGSGRY